MHEDNDDPDVTSRPFRLRRAWRKTGHLLVVEAAVVVTGDPGGGPVLPPALTGAVEATVTGGGADLMGVSCTVWMVLRSPGLTWAPALTTATFLVSGCV